MCGGSLANPLKNSPADGFLGGLNAPSSSSEILHGLQYGIKLLQLPEPWIPYRLIPSNPQNPSPIYFDMHVIAFECFKDSIGL